MAISTNTLNRVLGTLNALTEQEPDPPPTDEFIKGMAERLTERGFRRDIAGDDNFGAIIDAMWKIRCDKSKPLAIRKRGLLLTGNAGTGKTTAGKAAYGYNRIIPMYDETLMWSLDFAWSDDAVMLDDLGTEEIEMEYGNIRNRFARFMAKWVEKGTGLLVVTTNLNAKELEQRYGSRLFSRLHGNLIPIRFTGADRREMKL